MSLLPLIAVFSCKFCHLPAILERIIHQILDWHCVVDFGLVLYAENHICCIIVVHNGSSLQGISESLFSLCLHSILFISVIWHCKFSCIYFYETLRVNDRFPFIDEIVECISKYFVVMYIVFCNTIL